MKKLLILLPLLFWSVSIYATPNPAAGDKAPKTISTVKTLDKSQMNLKSDPEDIIREIQRRVRRLVRNLRRTVQRLMRRFMNRYRTKRIHPRRAVPGKRARPKMRNKRTDKKPTSSDYRPGKVKWNTKDLARGLKLAQKRSVPIFLYFGARW